MAAQEIRETKKMGRPPGRTKPETALIRVQIETLQLVDAWIADQPEPRPSRPEAMRVIVADWMTSHGQLQGDVDGTMPATRDAAVVDRYADADPDEGVMVTGVGPMTLRRAVRKLADWRDHHGLTLINVFRGADKKPGTFDASDLDRLATLERFR